MADSDTRQTGYDHDFVEWSDHQAELLHRRARGELVNDTDVDWQNVAEEIEALGRSDRRELRNRIRTILVHLMKLEASTAQAPRAGWRETIAEQRTNVRVLLDESPSLRPTVTTVIRKELASARQLVVASLATHGEQPLVDIGSLEFTEDQVLRDDAP